MPPSWPAAPTTSPASKLWQSPALRRPALPTTGTWALGSHALPPAAQVGTPRHWDGAWSLPVQVYLLYWKRLAVLPCKAMLIEQVMAEQSCGKAPVYPMTYGLTPAAQTPARAS